MPKVKTKKKETLQDVIDSCKAAFDEINRSNRCSYESMKRQFSSLVRQHKETLEMFKKSCNEHTKYLGELARTNENVSDTLLNVLLAIRQNEYLQAWYPPQQGFPEMKVSGSHPSKLMKAKDG